MSTNLSPAARLDALLQKITSLQTEHDQLTDRRPALVVEKLKGDPDAATRLAALDEQLAAIDAELRNLRHEAGNLQPAVANAQAKARMAEVEGRPLRIAELRRDREARALEATTKMADAASALRALVGIGDDLALELGTETARRFLSFEAVRARFQSAVAREFAVNAALPLTRGNSILGIESAVVGERAHWTFLRHEEVGQDDLYPFFLNEPEALAAKGRLAARQTPTIVVAFRGCFILVPIDRVFGNRETAERAANGRALTIVAHQDGYVLLPERIAGAA